MKELNFDHDRKTRNVIMERCEEDVIRGKKKFHDDYFVRGSCLVCGGLIYKYGCIYCIECAKKLKLCMFCGEELKGKEKTTCKDCRGD